ncbi:ras association domain-containing protein 8-like [Clinocottus analis]|uniref:ras association domain-containing protein 8-like n=1 Tax=Clinocottus analis TaxID=304258 RepID=UPI0035C00A33
MEVKVLVDGLPRVVCGVTEETTCQDAVIALAQALGRPGRYTLQEKFKDFERCMAPGEFLLETLEKYGEQAREVRLTLLHNGPSPRDDMSRAKVGRYQPCPPPPLRRKDVGARTRRGSASKGLHRQSLPTLSCSSQDAERQKKEDLKGPKRKSLTLMEEAWEWLESLGKGKFYSTAPEKESSKKTDKRNRSSLGVSLTVDEGNSGRSSRSKVRGQKGLQSDLDHQTTCCMGSQARGKESKRVALSGSSAAAMKDEKNRLRETITLQLSRLQELQVQIANTDRRILELEGKQGVRKAEREARQRTVEEEREQIQFWENELKDEEGYEKDLQRQFLEMRENAAGCKAKLEDYRRKMQRLDFFAAQSVAQEDSAGASATAGTSGVPTLDLNRQRSDPDGDVDVSRKFPPRDDLNPPHARVPPSQIKERRPTGPTELREWWTRWAQAQIPQSQSQKAVIHRSELTIYLSGTKSQTLSQ